MKICSKCKQIKSSNMFYRDTGRNDGLYCQCKDCHKAYYLTDEGKASRKRWSISEKKREHNRKYAKTELSLVNHKIKSREYRRANPEKARIRSIVSSAVKYKHILPAKSFQCSFDGCIRQAQEYHHISYEIGQELNVIPYCAIHHRIMG